MDHILPTTTFKTEEDIQEESTQELPEEESPIVEEQPKVDSTPIQEHRTYSSKPVNPYKTVQGQTPEEVLARQIMKLPDLPAGTIEQYNAFSEAIVNYCKEKDITPAQALEKMREGIASEIEQYQFDVAARQIQKLNSFGFGEIIKSEDPTNDVHYGGYDQVLERKKLMANKTKPSPEFSFAKFQSILGLGYATIVPLYHSGFSVVINPPTQSELLKIQLQLLNSDQELGYSTSGYFNTAKKSRVIAILKEYIQSKIIDYTLDISNKEDLFDYISFHDFDILVLALLRGAYDHISVVRTCFNALDPDVEKSRCAYTVEAKLNPAKLLHISRTMLTDSMLITLAKRGKGTVSIPEQANYVINLNKRLNEIRGRIDLVKMEENGVGFEVKFKTPTVSEYISASEEWILTVEKEIDQLLELNTNITVENAKRTIGLMTAVSTISSGIEYIKAHNDTAGYSETFDETGQINNILNGKASQYDDSLQVIQEAYVKYTNNSPIAYIATPAYECPGCRSIIGDEREVYQANNLIGFNIIDFFFSVVEHQKVMVGNQAAID